MIRDNSPALSLFYCYAYEDASFCDKLNTHLAMLRQLGLIQSWSDYNISAGTEWQEAMYYYLNNSDILLLLLSADFIHSDYCYNVVMQRALQRHQANEAVVIPIIVRPVEWKQTPLGVLQALPKNGQPVILWEHHDEAWKQIAAEIRYVVESLQRLIIVVASPPQQDIARRLISQLEDQRIAFRYMESVSETSKLQEAIRDASAVVLITSPKTHSTYLFKETQDLATLYQRPTFAIWIAETDQDKVQNTLLEGWGKFIFTDQKAEHQEATFKDLLYQLKQLRYNSVVPTNVSLQNTFAPFPKPRNPYKGLRAFTSNDTRDFFGRTALVDRLACSIEIMLTLETKGKQPARFLTVVGPSGSGKSSVVMAGLLPCLHTGEVVDSETWVYLDPLVPGEHPIEALTLVLFEHFPEKSLQMLRNDLQDETASGLHLYATALARRKKSISTYAVLVIDQFEELFTLTANEQERQLFINLLVKACTQPGGSLIVIITLRADFYDRPMRYPALYSLIEKHQTAMLPMNLDDLRDVITQPAALSDVQLIFEENLVGDLLFDMQGQVGALPLLQFTLAQLFQLRDGYQLTRHSYDKVGGIKGALARHAEQSYQDLPSSEHRTCAHALFLRLIDPGITEQDTTRRRTALSEFTFTNTIQTQCMQETMDVFIQARLLTTNQSAGRTTIEVSHEAVIREWKRLAEWLYEAREDIRLQKTISEEALEWERRNKPRDRLYRGIQLKEARMWAVRNTPSKQEEEFLQASTVRRIQSFMSLFVVVLLLASSISAAGWYYFQQPPSLTLVTNIHDNEVGSLRWCINNAPTKSIITFAQNIRGMITFSGGNLSFINKDLTLNGPGENQLTIHSSDAISTIYIYKSAKITISGLRFQGSHGVNQSMFSNNGTLSLSHSTIVDNSLSGFYDGGGISNNGTLMLRDSTISGNAAPDGLGGGISNNGNLMLINSTISGNSAAGGGGGGIYNNSALTLKDSTISGNSAAYGGGISNSGILTLRDSTIASNFTVSNGAEGGGIYNIGGATLRDSTIVDNSTTDDGGGIYNNGNSNTLPGNVNSNNSAISGGGADFGNQSNSLMILFCTIYANSARLGGGGGLWIDPKEPAKSYPVLANSIIAANHAQRGPDISGPLTTKGYNLIQNFASASFPGFQKLHSTDQQVTRLSDLHLYSSLHNNGGPTRTLALLPDSSAIDAIPLYSCDLDQVTTDQRGVKRPQGTKCDIGAYEYQISVK